MGKNITTPKLSILTEEQVYGNNKLNIFKVIGPEAAVSDTAILRGAFVSSYHVDNDSSLSGRIGYYWLQNSDGAGDARGVYCYGGSDWDLCTERIGGVRAALPYSQIKNLPHTIKTRLAGLEEITYGYYPGAAVDSIMQDVLNSAYNSGTLKRLGVSCTFDGRRYNDYDKYFLPEEQVYFEYNGEIYTNIRANSSFDNFTLSNGENYKNEDYVWTKVEPIIWLKHPDDDIMISEKEIIAGVRFYKHNCGYNGDFSKTEIKWFLDNFLSKEIFMFNPLIQEYIDNIEKENHEPENKTTNNYVDLYKNNKPIAKIKVKTLNIKHKNK